MPAPPPPPRPTPRGSRVASRLARELARRPARVAAFTAALAVVAGLATVQVASLPTRAAPLTIPWWLLAALFALAETCVVHVQLRSEAQSFSLTEVPLVLGLFFDPSLSVVLACLLGAAVALTLVRRQSPLKLAFNLSNLTLCAAVAILIFDRIAAHGSIGNVSVAAVLAAVTAAGTLQVVAFALVILLAEGRVDRTSLVTGYAMAVFGIVINTCLGLIGVTVLWFHPEVVWLLVVPAGGVAIAYRAYVAEHENRRQVDFLYRSSRRLQVSEDVDLALLDVLQGCCATFHAEVAQVVIFPTRDAETMVRAGVGPQGAEPMRSLELNGDEERLIAGMAAHAPAILDPSAGDPQTASFLEREGLRDGMIAVLRGETRPIGLMLVGNRLGQVSTFAGVDLRLFEMLAAHTGSTLENGRLVHSLRQLTDLQHKLRHQALHDPLTGMANRALFHASVGDALAGGTDATGVLFIDLDDFKTVNDSLGHVVGDELLRAVAGRIGECLRPGALAARLGGDEFAVLLPGIADSRAATAVAGRVVERLREPFQVLGEEIIVRASIGIATGVAGEVEADELLRNADEAMYTAKGLGKGRWEVFAPSMHEAVRSRHQFKADLHRALERDELVVQYQPMFATTTGEVVAAEALLRWRHPRHGLVQPADFIPLAEETGLIAPIGLWVMEAACAQARRWQERGDDVSIAVNVSPRQLQRGAFIEEVRHVLETSWLEPRHLIVEVTESLAVDEVEAATGRLQQLRELGVRIALDDFGTGHSSLSRLRDFPIDIIKIDKAFTTTLGAADGGGLSHAVFSFGHSLGVTVVAEGVEDLEHMRALGDYPGQWAQGFHLAPPLDPDDLVDLLERQRRRPAGTGARVLHLPSPPRRAAARR